MTNNLQEVVSSQMSETVVDLLEVIDIEKADHSWFSLAYRFCCLGEGLVKCPFVWQACKRVDAPFPSLVPAIEVPGKQA